MDGHGFGRSTLGRRRGGSNASSDGKFSMPLHYAPYHRGERPSADALDIGARTTTHSALKNSAELERLDSHTTALTSPPTSSLRPRSRAGTVFGFLSPFASRRSSSEQQVSSPDGATYSKASFTSSLRAKLRAEKSKNKHLDAERLAELRARKQQDKPARPDLLEKQSTKKLTDFFNLVNRKEHRPALQISSPIPIVASPPGAAFSPPAPSPSSVLEALGSPPRVLAPAPSRCQRSFAQRNNDYLHRLSSIPEDPQITQLVRTSPAPPPTDRSPTPIRSIPSQILAALAASTAMDPSLLAPGLTSVAEQQDQAKRVKDAKETYQMIVKNAERTGRVIPAFDFLELIGKGAYGRVYKCRDQKTGSLVAVKITEVDSRDWIEATESGAPPRDDTIRDFRKEVSTLQQLKDKGIPNINVLHDAFDMHAQVWMISDYCTGGSVRTLMRPFAVNGEPRGLPEKYIIPIARELAIAIAGCHESGIIHRDIKCANVFITEDGKIQLGDFGVVGVLENQTDKRRTIIGTPHYMPQEVAEKLDQPLDEDEPGYGSEVDIWAYGCTLYEMATGHPPYWKVPPKKIHEAISKGPPRVTDESYSPELRDLIAMCTEIDPDQRPAATTILQHPAIANTSREYPTRSLVPLIERLKIWERGGGSRQSLWIQAPSDPRSPSADNGDDGSDNDHGKSSKWSMDGWNFSTSEDFDRRFSQLTSYNDANMQYLEAPHGAGLPPAVPQINTKDLTVAERIKREHTELSANRGEKLMARLFDPNDPTGYDSSSAAQNTPVEEPSPSSDLPLRNFTGDAPTRESMIEIDLDDAGAHGTATSVFALHMENEHTIKPIGRRFVDDEDDSDNFQFDQRDSGDKRDTMAWTFPSAPQPQTQLKRGTLDWTFSNAGPAQAHEAEPSMDEPDTGYGGELAPGVRPTIKHTATEPVGHFRGFSPDMAASLGSPVRESVASMIDLDLGFVDPYEHIQNPAEIARPSTASSAAGSTMTDMTSGNPFDLEEDPVQNELDRQRFSYHKQWQSEGGHMDRADHRAMPMHARGSSLSSTDSDMDPLNTINQRADPAAESMQHPPFNVDQGLGGLSPDEMNQWPNFSSFDGFDTSPQQFPSLSDIPRLGEPDFPLEHGLRTNTNGLASRSREPSGQPPGPTIDFPAVNPPHPEALVENANSQLLEQEFSRALNDMADSLDSMVQGFRQYMPVDDDDDGDVVSESEGTEDEGSAGEHLTYRRANR